MACARLPAAPLRGLLFLAFALLATAGSARAATPEEEATPLDEVAEPERPLDAIPVAGPFEFPWSIGFLPSGRLLVTEKPGRLQIVDRETGARQLVQGTPRVLAGSHAGLLDVLVDPAFADNGTIFFSYVHGTPQAATVRVMRARLLGRVLVSRRIIFESFPPAPGLEQLGGRLVMDGRGLIYLSLGDRFDGARAQSLEDDAGSIVRFDRDGRIPPDNPFVALPGARPEIFSFGHRNPEGLAFKPSTGELWSHEHGPKGGDEINVIEPGRNYGWPVITYGIDYDGTPVGIGTVRPGMEQPAHVWTPSIAPSGMAFYEGEVVEALRGSLLVGALAGQMIVSLRDADGGLDEQRYFVGELGRIRDVRASPDGQLYFITDDPEGYLYRIAPSIEQAHRRGRTHTR